MPVFRSGRCGHATRWASGDALGVRRRAGRQATRWASGDALGVRDAAVVAADRAGRDPRLGIEDEEAGAAVRSAVERVGTVGATAQAAHRTRPTAEIHGRGTREHSGWWIPFRVPRDGRDPRCASHDPGSGVGARIVARPTSLGARMGSKALGPSGPSGVRRWDKHGGRPPRCQTCGPRSPPRLPRSRRFPPSLNRPCQRARLAPAAVLRVPALRTQELARRGGRARITRSRTSDTVVGPRTSGR